jgi:hypothetical protein
MRLAAHPFSGIRLMRVAAHPARRQRLARIRFDNSVRWPVAEPPLPVLLDHDEAALSYACEMANKLRKWLA